MLGEYVNELYNVWVIRLKAQRLVINPLFYNPCLPQADALKNFFPRHPITPSPHYFFLCLPIFLSPYPLSSWEAEGVRRVLYTLTCPILQRVFEGFPVAVG